MSTITPASTDSRDSDSGAATATGERSYRYPGSPPFRDVDLDRRLFKGRDEEAKKVFHSILSSDVFLLYAVSGMGKSSLLNALCPDIELRVGAVSDYKSMGRHTTVVSTLHSLPGGGELIDTPGFRDFGMVAIAAEDLSRHFPGLESRGDTVCRFRNCRHRTEPRCAVTEGVEEGRIRAERYATYLELLDEIEGGDAV